MGRTYILAFGGTGAKVLESVTMLLASDAFKSQEIVPLLIDLDRSGRKYCEATDLMELYRSINNTAYPKIIGIRMSIRIFGVQN